ncbi:BTAD domain-containing putative transcriptional regulator [Actinomadura rupiterrae]|uniref:BTAD domain-containing putative transcriptional regulator n=1 Tax=Actinomadura rupiterrae TaxID=559627 RepID=UPI0020A2EC98|nr:BTAD domain-containing putative transcriptional regulator [Actinomadura rupiterrae]MCP2339545.1 putative ATPase/DNA-binding SARP family transcriptional activator [Actinomadura rupiterrae]
MEFGVLGPVEVRVGEESVAVGGPRVRALLGMLALSAGRVVTTEHLIDGLYGDEAPSGAVNALQSQVSRLRRGLGDASLVEGHAAGYRLNVPETWVDALRFAELARDGRRALGGGEAAWAVELLEEALGLWRGPALADVREAPFAEGQAARLEEARVAAVEDLAEAQVAAGMPGAAVERLRLVVEAHPLRERARGLLMRALYGTGRQAEALEAYENARQVLADELGTDPSSELADLHVAILRGDLEKPAPKAESVDSGSKAEVDGSVRTIPSQLTSFVGRDDELRRIGEMLANGRLVTLLGPGGAGKTRLAVEAASRQEGEVCFVELAAAGTPGEVAPAVVGALGMRRAEQVADPVERLVAGLGDRRILLVLDNCEQVVEEVARLAHRLLTSCPGLRVLTTSREGLGVTGEVLCPIPPLPLPPEDAGAHEAAEFAAVKLFAERAAAVRPGFVVDEENAADVRRICAALDGLPLAIELAAARLRSLPVAEVAARLDDRFRLLSRGNRAAAPRHQTLRAVVGWSWDLLDEEERVLARRLSVFNGGWTRETAEAVCGVPDAEELLEGLADKSLVRTSDGVRFQMLQTIRAFCAERLHEAGEASEMQVAHVRYFLDLAERADVELRGHRQLEWLARLTDEHANLHTALRLAVRSDRRSAMQLVAALSWYWWLRGRVDAAPLIRELLDLVGEDVPADLDEEYVLCVTNAVTAGASGPRATAWLERASALVDGIDHRLRRPSMMVVWALTAGPDPNDMPDYAVWVGDDPWTQALIKMSDGYMLQFRGRLAEAEASCAAAVEGFRALGDRWGVANSLDPQAYIADRLGDRERALTLLNEALTLTRELGALEDTADLLSRRGEVHIRSGDFVSARADLEAAKELSLRAGTPDKTAAVYHGLGQIARLSGDIAEARRLFETSLYGFVSERFLAIATRAAAVVGLGWIAEAEGDLVRARELHRQGLTLAFDHPIFMHRAEAALGLAGVALGEGNAEQAALLIGAATALAGVLPSRDPDLVRIESGVRAAIGDSAYEKHYERGAALSPDAAKATALAD